MLKTGLKISKLNELNKIRKLLSPYTKRAYIVGGSVRDMLLSEIKSSKKNIKFRQKAIDFDIEIYDIKPAKFDVLMNENGASGVGKSYFVYKFGNFDLSLPRTESKVGKGHKAFEVSYCNDEREASRRRDFTVNSIMINIFSGEILDFNGGINDLKKGVLRHIDDEKFCEDSLRVLRAIQFSARLNFMVAPKTLKLMKTLRLNDLSKDRIAAELLKLFRAKFQHTAAAYLHELGLFKTLFGLNLSKFEVEAFGSKLAKAIKFKKDEREFLYLLAGMFGLKEPILKELNLPNSFKSCFTQPFFIGRVSDKELLEISLKMPLKDWLGLNSATLIKRAKKFGVYDKKFDAQIDSIAVIKDGFKNERIGAEILRRQRQEIEKFLENFKAQNSKQKPI
ncbi:CCA tRNA nucleotidyltransferase [Campylobacter sp.]|uniref:CCA tRNA nucleotidyltransferase n=1 Tax=Campylobacter sp. TaxID=205 RepID=UPI0026FB09F0|nr:CCA tRNA nucleotidyltransferase [Campylobacter sp.]